MKDVVREELELKLFGALMNDEGALPAKALEVLEEALKYVQNNPSIRRVEVAADELECKVITMEEDHCDSDRDYEDARYRLDAYREAVLIMEELA